MEQGEQILYSIDAGQESANNLRKMQQLFGMTIAQVPSLVWQPGTYTLSSGGSDCVVLAGSVKRVIQHGRQPFRKSIASCIRWCIAQDGKH